MKPSNYETIDWEEETRSVAAAFGQPDSIEVVHGPSSTSMELRFGDKSMHLRYSQRGCAFITIGHIRGTGEPVPVELLVIGIGWDGSIFKGSSIPDWPTLGKGLILLGLLSPAMQTEFGCPFSAHEKLEWQMEYEARMKET